MQNTFRDLFFLKKSEREVGLFFKNIPYVHGYKIRKKCFMKLLKKRV